MNENRQDDFEVQLPDEVRFDPEEAPPIEGELAELPIDEYLDEVIEGEPWDEEAAPKRRRFSLPAGGLKKLRIPAAVLVLAIAAIFVFGPKSGNAAQAGVSYINHTVAPENVTLTLSGTGSLSPADSYTVTTLLQGEIVKADFEEGDVVEKGALLYEIDSSDAHSSIEQAELSLSQSQRSYNEKLETLADLNVKATDGGQVIDLAVELGDKVNVGQTVATIRESATMRLEIPFGSDDANELYVGQSAQVTLDGSFETLTGTISEISGVEERLDGNRLVRKVKIDVQNPGGIANGQAATATVGGIASAMSGSFAYRAEKTVTAEASGEVSVIHVKEGDVVSANQTLITLRSTSLQTDISNSADSLRSSQISLESKYDQLEDYQITSPISGTIIEKFYKAGDTLESGKILCTVFDLSYLTMTLNVDELDVSRISVGQPVTVTAEALPGKTYAGVVTKVNINGTTANGVTSYPVTIRIDETDGLLPGMNVQAAIVVAEEKNAVAIPVSALARGNRVLVQGAASAAEETDEALPAGFGYVTVTTGISDGTYITITSGLKVGDVIAYTEAVVPSSGMGMMVEMDEGPPADMPEGGGPPAGGPSGRGG